MKIARTPTSVQQGAEYTRSGSGSVRERACVLDVSRDEFGIPHVRFRLQVERGVDVHSCEMRTLSLESFCSRFQGLGH